LRPVLSRFLEKKYARKGGDKMFLSRNKHILAAYKTPEFLELELKNSARKQLQFIKARFHSGLIPDEKAIKLIEYIQKKNDR
jgi:hypothetical protein